MLFGGASNRVAEAPPGNDTMGTEGAEMLGIIKITLVVIAAIAGFIATMMYKRRMERGLGRKVDPLEMNSISNWMEVAEREDGQGNTPT